MFALYVALLAAVWLSSFDGAEAQNYTIHSSVIFARTGDRTPLLMSSETTQLTALGSLQMYNLGSYFRSRYIGAGEYADTGDSVVTGLSSWRIDADQIYIQAIDTEYTATSAQAFMQAFYPPNVLNNVTAEYLEPSSILSNNSYVETPLGGYQYAMINTVGAFDPYSIYITGTTNCAYFDESALEYYNSAEFNKTDEKTQTMYQSVGHAVLSDVLPQSQWSFENGYLIYDYVSYQYLHNGTAKEMLDGPAYRDNLDLLGALAAEKQWAIYGDLSKSGIVQGDDIRAIAGRTLAARILGLLMGNMGSSGLENKVNLLVGEYSPMISLFSLMDLPSSNINFKSLPPFGSALSFELFSREDESSVSNGDGANYPSQDDLWVQFLYINGSTTDDNPSPNIQAYPIFDNGPDSTEMRWVDFESMMLNIMLSDISDWCVECGQTSVFCPAFVDGSTGTSSGSGSSGTISSSRKGVSPAVAGVIGAIVTLAVAAIFFGIASLIFGVRVRRDGSRKKPSDLGGFKGSAKLASDPDLSLPKNAAAPGIMAVDDKKGHERVGSWELAGSNKDTEGNTFGSISSRTAVSDGLGDEERRKPSFEEDGFYARELNHGDVEHGINPFQEPVKPREGF